MGSMDRMHTAMTSIEPSVLMTRFVQVMLRIIKLQSTWQERTHYGNDPQIRRLAQEIITDQQLEFS